MNERTVMSDIEGIYEDLEADVSLEEFQEAVDAKVEQMGGLADEETAAILVANELGERRVEGVGDVEPGMEEVTLTAKVLTVGELRTFERDGEDEPDGRVVNVEVADETGAIRAAFWDEMAEAAVEELEEGTVLRLGGRPKEGLNGVEVSVQDVEIDEETEIEVNLGDTYAVEDLSLGLSDVSLCANVLETSAVRTFDRDDGDEGRVANLTVGDPTGRVRVTLWDEMTELVESIDPGTSVEIIDGYVRERDGQLELHVGNRGAVEPIDEDVEYVPDADPIEGLEIGETVDIAGVVRSADPKRTFDRDDGSEGQVRNVRVQDPTGDIRVALWSEKADVDLGPGDEVVFADVEIQEGWQDDLEASAGWRSSVIVLDSGATPPSDAPSGGATGLDAFANDGEQRDDGSTASGVTAGAVESKAAESSAAASHADDPATREGESIEFTGVVVQAGDPVVLDDGERTMSVVTDERVHLGEEVTARGVVQDGRLEADDVV